MKEQMNRRRRLTKVWAAVAAGTMVAGLAGGVGALGANAAPAGTGNDVPLTSTVNGYRNVGYFAQWGVYGRAFQAKQLDVSGTAQDLTHINYSFGNINNQTLTCFMANKAQGTGPTGSDGAGDAWADFGMGYAADKSVSGAADTWDQPLAGSFNQLKQLKAKNPKLKVMISLGGWTWSKNFSKAAATQQSRQKLVSSCIDLYIKGNLPNFEGRGGAGAAAGIFDGIDIDWEWPGTNSGLEGNGVDTVNDRANFKALLAEFRTQLDAYGSTSGKKYVLSAFLPANPEDIDAGGWDDPDNFKSLDFGNIQGYDLHGAWNPTLTGHQANLYDDPADPREPSKKFSADKAVKKYLAAGIDPKQLGLGLAAYGRGWTGATSVAPWGPATDGAPGTYEKANEDYDKLKTLGTDHYNAATGAAWRYDGTQWWSYDNVATTKQKTDYILSKGLGGGMWWELSGDRNGELIGAMSDKFRAAAPGPVTEAAPPVTTNPSPTPSGTSTPTPTDPSVPGECSAPVWSGTAVYTGGSTVSYNGLQYKAKWWTQGNAPGTDGVWQKLADCTGSPTDPSPTPSTTPTSAPTTPPTASSCGDAWRSTATYAGGAKVSLDGTSYKAKWWTVGERPGELQWGAWENLGACT